MPSTDLRGTILPPEKNINITGDIDGNVLSGSFSDQVQVGDGQHVSVDTKASKGQRDAVGKRKGHLQWYNAVVVAIDGNQGGMTSMTTMQDVLNAAHRLSPAEQFEIINMLLQTLQQRYSSAEKTDSSKNPRVLGLHRGLVQVSDDFDAALPDSFWLGEDHAVSP